MREVQRKRIKEERKERVKRAMAFEYQKIDPLQCSGRSGCLRWTGGEGRASHGDEQANGKQYRKSLLIG